MVEPCRFSIRKAGLVHAEDGATMAVCADGQADHAFMSAPATFAIMPRPCQFNGLAGRDMQHRAGHTVPITFRLYHHREPGSRPREIKLILAKRDPFRPPPGRQMRWRGDEVEDPVRRQRERLFNAQIGHGLTPFEAHMHKSANSSANRMASANSMGCFIPPNMVRRERHHTDSVIALRADRK